MMGNSPLTWVGVAGFEPAASSSRTKAAPQAVTSATLLTSPDIRQYPSAPVSISTPPDAPLTHSTPTTPLEGGLPSARTTHREP